MEDSAQINQEAVVFFGNLWKKSGAGQDSLKAEFLEVIPPLVSREDNRMLEEPVSLKELKATVFRLGGEKASAWTTLKLSSISSFGICLVASCWRWLKSQVLRVLF